MERNAPESAVLVCIAAFTAICRQLTANAAHIQISRLGGGAGPASNVNDHRDRDTDYFQHVTGSRCLLVQIPDRLSFGTQRTNILPRNDLTSQAVNFIALRRRPTAKILHAFQQA
jgi:hypothetical protein